jgi:hypothetical protein
VIDIDGQWELDLMDMAKFSKHNRGYNFILVTMGIGIWYLSLNEFRFSGSSWANNIFFTVVCISQKRVCHRK